jgi:hypothetical protein
MLLCRRIRSVMPATPISRISAQTTTPRLGALSSTPKS